MILNFFNLQSYIYVNLNLKIILLKFYFLYIVSCSIFQIIKMIKYDEI